MRALERNGRSQMEARATSSIRWAKKASGCDKCAVAGGKTACASCKRVRPHSFWLSLFPIFALATDIEMRAHTREVIMELHWQFYLRSNQRGTVSTKST